MTPRDKIAGVAASQQSCRRQPFISSLSGGSLLVAWAVGITHTRFDTLPGPSLFSQTFGSPIVDVDRTARVSAILDHRNSEYDARRGFLAELDVSAGSGGAGYTRFTGLTRVYVPLGARTVVAIGLVASRTAGGPPPRCALRAYGLGGLLRRTGGTDVASRTALPTVCGAGRGIRHGRAASRRFPSGRLGACGGGVRRRWAGLRRRDANSYSPWSEDRVWTGAGCTVQAKFARLCVRRLRARRHRRNEPSRLGVLTDIPLEVPRVKPSVEALPTLLLVPLH